MRQTCTGTSITTSLQSYFKLTRNASLAILAMEDSVVLPSTQLSMAEYLQYVFWGPKPCTLNDINAVNQPHDWMINGSSFFLSVLGLELL